MYRARTIVFVRPGEKLRCTEQDIPGPGEDELLIRVTHAGVCGTDVHRLDGDLGAPAQPICFGHEGVGIVEALGSAVRRDRAEQPLSVGDRVYWCPATPCGTCASCRRDEAIPFCEEAAWPVPFGGPTPATYQELATVHRSAAFFRVPDQVLSDAVIAFGCAMPTAVGGMLRLGDIQGSRVVIQGSGPVGLAACVTCSLAGASMITVIGDPQGRLDVASRLGATEVMSLASTSLQERRDRVMELTKGRGADIVIEAAGRIEAFAEGLDLLGNYGRYLIMGLYSGKATTPFNPVQVNNRNLSVIGSLGSPVSGYGRAVEIAAQHGERLDFAALVTHRFSLEETESAIACVRRADTIKAVVNPN